MYKIAKPDGWDFYTGQTINYRDSIGKIVRVQDYDGSKVSICCAGLRAFRDLYDCFTEISSQCSIYKVEGIQK